MTMKTTIFKLSAIILLLVSMGAGCEKDEKISNDDYAFINDIVAEVGNNGWQTANSEDLIWWLKIKDENENLPRKYLVPLNLPDEYKVSGLKVIISGKVFLKEFSSLAQSDPNIKITPGYIFEIQTIIKIN